MEKTSHRSSQWRNAQIDSQLEKIMQEISVYKKLLSIIQKHALHMKENLVNITNSNEYLQCFAEVNSVFLKYTHLLSVISCKVELSIMEDINKWNFKSRKLNFIKPFILSDDASHLNKNNSQNKYTMQERQSSVAVKKELSPYFLNAECYESSFLVNMKESPPPQVFVRENFTNSSENTSVFEKSVDSSRNKSSYPSQVMNCVLKQETGNNELTHTKNNEKCKEIQRYVADMVDYIPGNNSSVKYNSEDICASSIFCSKKHEIENIGINRSPNCYYKGYIQFAPSPSELYIYFGIREIEQMEVCERELKLLTAQKDNFPQVSYKQHGPPAYLKQLAMKELGLYALFYSEIEETFFRVKIVNWNTDEDNDRDNDHNKSSLVTIFFLDYGNTSKANLSTLYPVPESLMKFPAFATRCHLSAFIPEDSVMNANAKMWNESTLTLFRHWVKKNQFITIVIDESCYDVNENTCKTVYSLAVRLYDSEGQECLNTILEDSYRKGIGLQFELNAIEEKCDKDLFESDLDHWNPLLEDYNSIMNSYEIDINDPSVAIYGYSGKDYERVCMLYGKTGKCFKGKSCKKEHTLLDATGFTTDKEEVYVDAFNFLETPSVNQELIVHVTYILSPTEFYCVKDTGNTSTDEETLISLVRFMNKSENVLRMKKLSVPPAVGQVVVANFSYDGVWYRAKILDVVCENNICSLFFVDYGNTETVSFSNIRAIDPQYLHLPFQAIFCRIHGIGKKSEISVEEPIQYLDEIMRYKSRIVVSSIIPGNRPQIIVKLFDNNGQDVAKQLVDKGLVTVIDNMYFTEYATVIPG